MNRGRLSCRNLRQAVAHVTGLPEGTLTSRRRLRGGVPPNGERRISTPAAMTSLFFPWKIEDTGVDCNLNYLQGTEKGEIAQGLIPLAAQCAARSVRFSSFKA